jgi:hypothetical protein
MPRLDASHPEDAIAKFLALLPPELNPLIAAVRAAVGIGPQLDGEASSAMHVLRYRKVWGSGLARAGMYLLCEALRRLSTRRCGSSHIPDRRRLPMPPPSAWRFNRKPAFGQACYRNWYWQA